MLPRVKIYFENGLIGSQSASDDGICGLIATGVAVVNKFVLGTAYLITSLDGLSALGITSGDADANKTIYKAVNDFYTEAPDGTKLWIKGVADTVTLANMMDVTLTHAKGLIDSANGAIKILFAAKKDANGYTATITNGLDADVTAAITKAQALGEYASDTKYAPLFVILPGRHYSGVAADLEDLGTGDMNRVCVMIGDTVASSNDAAVGLLAGRVAAIPVQRSVARVKSGAIGANTLYIGAVSADNGSSDVINDLGYISFRSFVGKSGYYFTDDKLATDATDDYALIPRRRTIDKAFRIAYKTLVNELNDEVPVTDEGFIPHAICKSIQNEVETSIINIMGVAGELGRNPDDTNDTGVSCFIDPSQNIVATSQFKVKLRVKPFGYPKYIDLYIGFKTSSN